jgi:hypothetical protein
MTMLKICTKTFRKIVMFRPFLIQQMYNQLLIKVVFRAMGPSAPQAGLDLSTHASLSASKEKVRNRINKPIGDPLVMPQGGPMIKCNIDKINAWIDQGALNN